MILKKSVSSWYIFATFIIQHAFIGYAWYYWSNNIYNNFIYWIYWIFISFQFILFLYYPFYSEFVLNPEIPILNERRKDLCLWKICFIIEIFHIIYLIITDIMIPCLCLMFDTLCPINDKIWNDPDNIWISILILIALMFALISIFVLIYVICYLDKKLYKTWQIHCDYDNDKNRGYTISSPNIAHPELPVNDPYNLELQDSSSEFKL